MTDSLLGQKIREVSFTALPYDQWHDWYQEYYLAGLRAFLGDTRVRVQPGSLRRSLLRFLKEARHLTRIQRALGSLAPSANVLMDGFAAALGARRHRQIQGLGAYRFLDASGRRSYLRLDSVDSGELVQPGSANDCDVYLKCNYWPTIAYPASVRPFYNCNPVVLPHLSYLREARRASKEFDCCFIVRVWGGREEEEGVEHCIRMLQAMARVPGNNYLLGYLVAGDIPALEKRLRQLRIPSTTRPIPPRELWSIAARSRLNIIRLGMFHCIPWRMTDMLAMGACVVLDQEPKTRWPEPLVENEHFVALRLETSENRAVASDDAYEGAANTVASISADRALVEHIAASSAQYFDRFLSPFSIGRQICEIASSAAV